jgi:hypothetical protein
MQGKLLNVWMGGELEKPVGLPTPDQVLYSQANPDGTRKMCRNCVLWLSDQRQCVVHGPDLPVAQDAWCPRHTFGTPQATAQFPVDMDPADPATSGLQRSEGGVSCDRCEYFSPMKQLSGTCRAIKGFEPEEQNFVVAALAACSRWTFHCG